METLWLSANSSKIYFLAYCKCAFHLLVFTYVYYVYIRQGVYGTAGLHMCRCFCVCIPGTCMCVCYFSAYTHTHSNTHRQFRLCTAADPQRGVLGAA